MEFVLKIKNPVSILVRRRASLGDTVMSTAVVRELYKAHNGNCHITVETDYPLVYKNNPYIVDLRNWGEVNSNDFDVVYSPSQPLNVEKYPDVKFIFGPHFSVFPEKHSIDIISKSKNDNQHFRVHELVGDICEKGN